MDTQNDDAKAHRPVDAPAYEAGYVAGVRAETVTTKADEAEIAQAALEPLRQYLHDMGWKETWFMLRGYPTYIAMQTVGSFYEGFRRGVREREQVLEAERKAIVDAIEAYLHERSAA
jgi:hypothetical protein